MEDKLISYELALKLQLKGFCPRAFLMTNVLYKDRVAYITQSMLQKWFREVHHIELSVLSHKMDGVNTYVVIIGDDRLTYTGFSTYESALETGLLTALARI